MANRSEIARWTVSCVTVLVCYGAAATAILAWEPHYEIPSAPETIAMIDLAPLPPEPTPPPPAPPPPPKVKREEPPPETPPTPAQPVETAAVPTPAPAPRVAARVDPSPNVLAIYSARISAHVQKNLRYPLASLRRDERGTAIVIVTVNKDGRVLSSKLENPTGRRLLDEEAIAVIVRANPMPVIPPEIERGELELRIPVVFNIR